MFGTHDLWLFVVSGFVLNITPGPDNIYIAARSLHQGWRAGLVASMGIGCGVFIHVLAAALGLAALLAASATAFMLVKLVGAAYLLWLGLSLLRSRESLASESDAPAALPLWRIFRQGFITNVLNPKVALFFLAFVPQFISHEAPSKTLAFIFLGILFDLNSMLWCGALAWCSAKAGRRLRQSQGWSRWLNRTVGGLFVLLGVRLALVEQGN